MRTWLVLVGFLLATFSAGLVGSQFQPGAWYAALQKPPLTPPNWVFGPVWSALYLAMGIAAWLVWRMSGVRSLALKLWVLQLILNALWSWLYFGLQQPGWALIEIAVLLAAILSTAVLFYRVRPLAGWLLVPYAAWVSFAAYLNAGFWWLNR